MYHGGEKPPIFPNHPGRDRIFVVFSLQRKNDGENGIGMHRIWIGRCPAQVSAIVVARDWGLGIRKFPIPLVSQLLAASDWLLAGRQPEARS